MYSRAFWLSLSLSLPLANGALADPAAAPPSFKLKMEPSAVARDSRPAPSFASIVKKVSPNVVSVFVTKSSKGAARTPPLDDLLRDFFGERDGDSGMSRERREQGLGSGVILTEDGYIITSNHVVAGADELKVVLADGERQFTAKVVGTDPPTDIAVIKVDGKDLPPITVTDSDKLEVGDVVLAVGNPFGVGQTVTNGIVSAKSRTGMGIVDYEDFIQTDASINPGNSGGALVDAEGRLVGINTAILSRSGGNQGVGFAVSLNFVRDIMDQLVKEGKVTRGFLGVAIQALTPELAEEFKLSDRSGALVGDVTPESPAAKGGLKEGDVVLEFNGTKITNSRQLRLMVSQARPGTKVDVKIARNNKEKTLPVTLGELPGADVLAKSSGGQERRSTKGEALSGVEVTDLDPSVRQQLNVPGRVRGVVVTGVDPESPAASAGVQPGDVVLEINRTPVTSAEEAVEQSHRAKNNRTLLRLWSRGGSHYAVVDAAKK